MKFFVTGGTGFIGSNITERVSKDHNVIVLDDLHLGHKKNIDDYDVEFVKGSVMDVPLMNRLCKQCDHVFHYAAMSSSPMFKEQPKLGMEVNLISFMNVIKSAFDMV